MKKIFRTIVPVTLLFSCNGEPAGVFPLAEKITESVYASGNIRSADQYQVFSPVNGLIQKFYVSEGDTVKKGDALVQVKGESARLNIENAQLTADNAAVSANTEKLNELKTNISFLSAKIQNDSLLLERQRNLWSQEIGTRNELEQRDLVYKNDVAAYQAAIFRLKDLQKQIGYSAAQSKTNLKISKTAWGEFTVRSQMDGRIYSITKEEGEMVTAQTPLAVVGGAGDFILELQVDEYDIEKIRTGQKVLVTMDSYRGQVFEASITRIIPYMNDRTRSFTIESVFSKAPPALYPNLTVEANIMIQAKENAVTIPRDYLVSDSLVLLPGGRKRKVVTGLKDYQKVEIISGVTVADKIIKPSP